MSQFNLAIRGDQQYAPSANAQLLRTLGAALIDGAPVSAAVGSRVFATESISQDESQSIYTAAQNLSATLNSVVGTLNLNRGLVAGQSVFAQESAAIQGALCAGAAAEFVGRKMAFPRVSTKDVHAVGADGVPNYVGHRSSLFATEAFDNRETRSAVLYTMAFNYSMARQDEFGETVWPTLTLPADQVGFGIVVNRLTVHRGVTHTVDGKVVDFGKVDLMRAAADASVLRREKTRVYPVVRASNLDKLVPAAKVAPRLFNNEGVEILTAPYRVGAECGIIGMSQTDAMLDGGSANQTDTLDTMVSLDFLYADIGGDVLKFNVFNHPSANFTYAPQGVDKQRNLTFRSNAIVIDKKTLRQDGTALVALSMVKDNDLTVTLELAASGTANTEYGSCQVFGNMIRVSKVIDKDGNVLGATNPLVQDLEVAFQAAAIIGYDLRANRTNINMRERGDFIDRTSFTQLYEVPLLSPVTAQRPQNTDGQQDQGDFDALVQTTRFRLMGDGVTAILESCMMLKDYVKSGPVGEEIPASLGASRYHVKPVYFEPEEAIDVAKVVDSLSSGDRLKDLQQAVINIIRDYAFRMYVKSEYQAAASALGMQGLPTVIIATDPYIRRYIMLDGDLRTMTEKFGIRVVDTLDSRFAGRVFITFGVFDENRNQAPNILNWGNLVWSPEVVMSAKVPRGESLSMETIVQPRYRFVMHCPVATMLTLTNIPQTLTKLPLNVVVAP